MLQRLIKVAVLLTTAAVVGAAASPQLASASPTALGANGAALLGQAAASGTQHPAPTTPASTGSPSQQALTAAPLSTSATHSSPARNLPSTHPGVPSAGYTGALPFAYEAGFVSGSTNVTRIAQPLVGTPAAGISWKFRWADLETSPGVYNWSAVDNSINAARALHLPVMLRVVAGIYSPGWVLSSVPTVSVPNVYFPNTGPYANPTLVPVVWNSSYLADWTGFVRAFGARYDGNSSVYLVHAGGAGDIGDMYLPPDMAVWNAAGYSDSNLLAAWEGILSAYKQAFPRTNVAIGITEAIICRSVSPGYTNPTCAGGYQSNVLAPLAGWVQANDPRLFLQNNGLSGRYLAAGIFLMRKIMRAASAYTTIGYQTNGTASGLTDLTNAFTVARQDHAGYVEVYVNDLFNSAYAGAFRYLRFG